MSKKTLALILGLAILTCILLGVALAPLLQKPEETPLQPTPGQPTVTPTPPAYTTINLTPNPITVSQTGTVEVVVDTSENELTAVQLEIAYDPDYLTNVTVIPGSFFPNPIELLNTIDPVTGRITYALGITPAQSPISGTGTVATISFDRLPNSPIGQTTIDLLPKTLVTQQGIGASVLKETNGTTVNLTQQTTTQTPQTQTEPGVPELIFPPDGAVIQ